MAPIYRLTRSDNIDRIVEIADALADIEKLGIVPINELTSETIARLQRKLADYADGEYTIPISDLPLQVLPMIENVQSSYLSVQFIIPEVFWNKPWTEDYFNKNVDAAKRPGVDFLRVFIVDMTWEAERLAAVAKIVKKHTESGVPVSVVDRVSYARQNSSSDLFDFVIFDHRFTGTVEHGPDGDIRAAVFSTEKELIEERKKIHDRLRLNSVSGEDWLKTFGI